MKLIIFQFFAAEIKSSAENCVRLLETTSLNLPKCEQLKHSELLHYFFYTF